MCLSCSPSHPCPLVQSVRGRPLSHRCDCERTWSTVRWACGLSCRGQTVGPKQLKPPVCEKHTDECGGQRSICAAVTYERRPPYGCVYYPHTARHELESLLRDMQTCSHAHTQTQGGLPCVCCDTKRNPFVQMFIGHLVLYNKYFLFR